MAVVHYAGRRLPVKYMAEEEEQEEEDPNRVRGERKKVKVVSCW